MIKWSLEIGFIIAIIALLLIFEIYRLVKDRFKSILLVVLLILASFLVLKYYFSAIL